ncbi:type IV pilus biogenesis protein PilM [Acetomicrobium sp. S15 = DSM 107314]|uniref:type IV pilus biogenesis protein PilM n=1 Tax=Acetomicrobium sp. S15 = DSM 107314 TaxID=2529858 RepID=UPI0018E19CBF|nr:pilus assembly protein PilM [Acetomicrobium sp. S15 = DSM 107314]
MSIEPGGLRYVEISGALGDLSCRCALVPVLPAPVYQDALVDATGLLPALTTLKEEVGISPVPVSLGLPPRDVLLRVVELPPMELEEARAAIGFEFERHFPFPASEATYDLAPVEFPGSEGRFLLLVAASRRKSVEVLVDVASKGGLNLSALEPANLATFRAVCGPEGGKGGFMVLILGEETSQLVVAYKDNGILFRTLLFGLKSSPVEELASDLTREITSTATYIGGTFRGLKVEVLIINGGGEDVASAIQDKVSLPVALTTGVWDVWDIKPPKSLTEDGWEAAIGLAVRGLL